MRNFLFKCPRVGLLVQGSIEDARLPEPGALVAYECPACRSLHLVDPRRSDTQSPTPPPPRASA